MKLIKCCVAESRRQLADMYHCCRWCIHFKNDKCFNKEMIGNFIDYSSNYTYEVSENGSLDSVISETFYSVPKRMVTDQIVSRLRKYGLSEKKIKEIYDITLSSIDEWFDSEVKDKLDSNISRLYNLSNCCIDGICIQNPEQFCCERFE